MIKRGYCPECKWALPTKKDLTTISMNILNECFNCKATLWDEKGKFLGELKDCDCEECTHKQEKVK